MNIINFCKSVGKLCNITYWTKNYTQGLIKKGYFSNHLHIGLRLWLFANQMHFPIQYFVLLQFTIRHIQQITVLQVPI